MTDTANLALPFIDGSQAQKHVTHNEALRILDAAIQIGVADMNLAAPPPTPAAGERHVVASGATGAWAGQANAIATWEDGAWRFLIPKPGWLVWSAADNSVFVFDGTGWSVVSGGGGGGSPTLDNIPRVGINSIATSPNLLSVQSNAALFNSIDIADGGTGDARIQISKESSSNTASVVFSDAFSGRAEFGLIGSDDFKLKVSDDGMTFVEAFTIDQTSGNLALPRGVALSGVISPAQITANQDDYNPAGIASASVLQISSDASRTVSGLAGGGEGRIVCVLNVGSQTVTLADESASSSAANRFALGINLVIAPKQAAILRYDGTAARWFAIARSSSGSGGGGGLSEADRQNILLSRIYQSKLYGGYRRFINAFADGYKATDGINTGSSSNVDTTNVAASGFVAPSAVVATTGTFGGASAGAGRSVDATNGSRAGFQFVASASANVVTTKFTVSSVSIAGSWVARLYTNSGSSPGTQIGTDSNSQTISAAGDVTWTFPSPPAIVSGTTYWIILAPAATSTIFFDTTANNASYASGRNNAITSITNNLPSTEDWRCEVAYSTGVSNMTLITTSHTADASVSNGRVLLEYDNTANPTLNTDLTVEVTCNGGTNWTSASLSSVTTHGQSGRKVVETVDQVCTAGISFAARIKTLNNKNAPIYGMSLTVH